MAEQTIICPNCGKRIPVSKALFPQIEAELRETYEAKAEKDKRESQVAYEKKIAAETSRLEKQAEQRLTQEKSRLEKQARKDVEVENSVMMAGLQKQLREKDKQVAEAQKQKVEVEKKQNQLAAREKGMDTEVARKVEKASRKAREEADKKNEEKDRTHQRESDKKLSDANRVITDLKRKLEQGSQQTQGDAVENKLEKDLKKAFPDDKIERIAKGKAGADLLQKVYTSSGQYCGTIIWESKNTHNWSKAWLVKLRGDQRRAKAELAVLVSVALPKDVSHFAQVDGIWITRFPLVLGLATALRTILMQVALLKQTSEGKHENAELLYEYISSTEFKHRMEDIFEAFCSMRDDLGKERETMGKQWVRREKQMQLVFQNVLGMYGDMQAKAPSLPKIRRLELPAPDES